MALALRKIKVPKLWGRGGAQAALFAVSELIPSSPDEVRSGVSVFVVPDADQVPGVAAALSMIVLGGPSQVLLASAAVDDLAAAGLKLTPSTGKGTTLVAPVDRLHHDLALQTPEDLTTATRLFLDGQPFNYEAPELRRLVIALVRAGHYDFRELAKHRKTGTPCAICDCALEIVRWGDLLIQAA
jgi:hypothetical protein